MTWEDFTKIPDCNQSQEATQDQLVWLLRLANRCGLYDAADWLVMQIKHEKIV